MPTNNATNFTNPVSVNTGGTGNTTFTAYGPIAAGTTATGAFQTLGTGSSGQVLISNGAASLPTWQTQSGAIVQQITPVVLTSAQVKALHATPIQIIPAQGSGTFIRILNFFGKLTYGGNNAFTASASQTIQLVSNSGAVINYGTVLANTDITKTTTTYSRGPYVNNNAISPSATVENVAILVYNTIATEISGNAANDNTVTIYASYVVLTL